MNQGDKESEILFKETPTPEDYQCIRDPEIACALLGQHGLDDNNVHLLNLLNDSLVARFIVLLDEKDEMPPVKLGPESLAAWIRKSKRDWHLVIDAEWDIFAFLQKIGSLSLREKVKQLNIKQTFPSDIADETLARLANSVVDHHLTKAVMISEAHSSRLVTREICLANLARQKRLALDWNLAGPWFENPRGDLSVDLEQKIIRHIMLDGPDDFRVHKTLDLATLNKVADILGKVVREQHEENFNWAILEKQDKTPNTHSEKFEAHCAFLATMSEKTKLASASRLNSHKHGLALRLALAIATENPSLLSDVGRKVPCPNVINGCLEFAAEELAKFLAFHKDSDGRNLINLVPSHLCGYGLTALLDTKGDYPSGEISQLIEIYQALDVEVNNPRNLERFIAENLVWCRSKTFVTCNDDCIRILLSNYLIPPTFDADFD
jgi:hypothetical protein